MLRSETYIPVNDQLNNYSYERQDYAYDSLNRLSSVVENQYNQSGLVAPSFAQSYSYDRYGNRSIDTSGNPSKTWGYQINAQQSTIDPGTNRVYAPNDPGHSLIDYDSGGNQTKDNVNGSGTRLYDAENRMISANNGAALYTYSADGQRVRRNLSGMETWQVYGMSGELLAEYSANAATFVPHEEYGYRNGQLLITAANGDEARLTNFIYNFYFRFGVGFTSSDIQTRVNALAAAGNQGGSAQLFTEAQNQAQAIVSLSNIPSDTNYVTAIYLTYCQRYPDSGGLGYWVSQIPYIGRTGVRNAFAASGGEFSARVNNLWGNSANDNERTDAFVQYMYQAILHRWASGSEDTAAISAFDNAGATGQANVVTTAGTWAKGLFNSSEYASSGRTQHDFVYDLYQAFLRYAPDQAGWDWWTGQVGASWQNKQAVMDAFINAGPYAQQAGTLYREVLWLTPDHLGTPRMIAERTGSLAGIKRHDYLPFGEELFGGPPNQPGTSGRLTTQGYTADSVRQKFTLKERDIETGLDYFGARYYGSTQGRFTSVDPMLVDQKRMLDPQRMNAYSYAVNNPVRYVDPDGADPKDPKVVVVVFTGGYSTQGSSTSQVTQIHSGGSTEGLGESKLGYESVPLAQKIANDFPQAQVLLAGPDAAGTVFNQLSQSKPDNILIQGFSAGGVAAVDLTNQLNGNGQKVDQLTTVDVESASDMTGHHPTINNPGMVNDAVNFKGPADNFVNGAREETITPGDIKQKNTTKFTHENSLDIASPKVVKRIEGTLNIIYNPQPMPDRTKLPDGSRSGSP